jgi:hypothetical protein
MSNGFFPTPRETQQAAHQKLLMDPQLQIFRQAVQAEMERAGGRTFTVDSGGVKADVIALVSEELRRSGWVVSPGGSMRNESFLRVSPAPNPHTLDK